MEETELRVMPRGYYGITKNALNKCQTILRLPREYCLNVAVAGSIVMYDRTMKLYGNEKK